MTAMNSPARPGREGFVRCLLRLPEVCRRVGFSRSELYRRVCAKTFPAPIKLGERVSAWPSDEVEAWISERVAERDAKGAA